MTKEILMKRLNLLYEIMANRKYHVYNDKENRVVTIWKNDVKRWINIINLDLAKQDDAKFYMKAAQTIWEFINSGKDI